MSNPVVQPPNPSSPDPRQLLQTMLDLLGLRTKVEQYTQDDTPLLHIATADPARIIGRNGHTLNQLQYLVNRILQHANPNAQPIIVDCERYRERERDQLIRKALEAAEKVRRWGEPVTIGPFTAFERRIIHRYIARDPELEAVSEGKDDKGRKRMIIRPRAK
ncbi:MAG: KH domain-containing protein [Verrucomicrobiae bacterium]|nr:KH domain-containing protein [Verrucomicrobiae bacterium]